MKLTSEGAARLGRHEARGFPVSAFNFKPEDFDGCFQNGKDHIILTVEEAEYALKVVRFAITTCEAVNEHKDKLWNFASLLHRRIEQAEGK